jgi:hypothetical protein
VLERVSGRPFSELLSTELWSRIGAEHDALMTVDSRGFSLASGGVRDAARPRAVRPLVLTAGRSGLASRSCLRSGSRGGAAPTCLDVPPCRPARGPDVPQPVLAHRRRARSGSASASSAACVAQPGHRHRGREASSLEAADDEDAFAAHVSPSTGSAPSRQEQPMARRMAPPQRGPWRVTYESGATPWSPRPRGTTVMTHPSVGRRHDEADRAGVLLTRTATRAARGAAARCRRRAGLLHRRRGRPVPSTRLPQPPTLTSDMSARRPGGAWTYIIGLEVETEGAEHLRSATPRGHPDPVDVKSATSPSSAARVWSSMTSVSGHAAEVRVRSMVATLSSTCTP